MSLNDLPQQKLREIILQYGRAVCDDPQRCEALLRDYCGQYRKEISVLVNALKERVPTDLLASQSTIPIPHAVLLAQLTQRLQDNLGLAEDAARWAVESWGLALGVISGAETTSNHSPSPPPQVPPQYRQENINQTPIASNYFPSPPPQVPQENIDSRRETDPSFQQPNPTVARENNSRLAKANQQIRNAWIAGTISGTITLIFTFVLTEPFLLIDVLLIFGLTWGIYQKSRACAVIMFIYFIISKIVSWQTFGNPMSLLVAILFIYSFWQGIQGTFAYHKIN